MFTQEIIVEMAASEAPQRLTRILAVGNVNLRGVSLAECRGRRVMHLVVDNPDEAIRLCRQQGFRYETALILALQIGDAPGELAGVLDAFQEAGVLIEYFYTSIALPDGGAVVLIHPQDLVASQKLVEEKGFHFLNRL